MNAPRLFTLLLCLTISTVLSAQSVSIKDINYEGFFSLPGTPVVSLAQTSDGFIWAGVYGSGLMRYYGAGGDFYGEGQGLSGSVRKIIEDKRGYLWAGCHTLRGQPGQLTVSSAPVVGRTLAADLHFRNAVDTTLLLTSNITDLNIDGHGQIWAVSDSTVSVYRWVGDATLEAIVVSQVGQGQLAEQPLSVLPLEDGTVWLSYKNEPYIYQFELTPTARKAKLVNKLSIDPDRAVDLTYADEEGMLWGHYENNIPFHINPQNGEQSWLALEPAVSYIRRFDDQTVMAPSQGNGLILFDRASGKKLATYGLNQGLPSATLFDAFVSDQGDLWLATINGISRLPADFRAFTHYTDQPRGNQPPLLSEASTTTVNTDLWRLNARGDRDSFSLVGTTTGLLIIPREEEPYMIGSAEGLPIGIPMGAVQDEQGGIYLASLRSGMCYIRPGGLPHPAATKTHDFSAMGPGYKIDQFQSQQQFLPYLFKLPGATEQSLWLGQRVQLSCLARGNKWMHLPLPVDERNRDPFTLQQDSQGFIHAFSNIGWFRSLAPFTQDNYAALMIKENLSEDGKSYVIKQPYFERVPITYEGTEYTNVNTSLLVNDMLWVGVDSLILVVDPATAQIDQIKVLHGGNRITTAMAEGPDLVWLGTDGGLFGVRKDDLSIEHYLREEDGLLHTVNWSPNGLAASADGRVWQGTAVGLQVIDPALNQADEYEWPVYLTKINFEEDDWGRNEYAVSYSLLSYRDDPEQIQYQTRLLGYDEDWSAPSTETSLRYTNLKAYLLPKTYEMEVRATDYRGNVFRTSAGLYPVTVNPPLHFRWWAVLIYVGLLALAINAFLRYRLREQEKRIRLQEAETIRQQRDEIAAKNAENETLLKEIHHRVKNNLEVVSSLLELQSATLQEGDARDAMLSGQSRVASMGLLHKKLYQGNNLSTVNMATYLSELTGNITETYELSDRVSFQLRIPPDLALDVDRAVPVGLIVNELVTNALKYAFAEEREDGEITVEMSQISNKTILAVSDNGSGKTAGLTQGTGFGTRLVHLLTQQLEGELREENDQGLRTEIAF